MLSNAGHLLPYQIPFNSVSIESLNFAKVQDFQSQVQFFVLMATI